LRVRGGKGGRTGWGGHNHSPVDRAVKTFKAGERTKTWASGERSEGPIQLYNGVYTDKPEKGDEVRRGLQRGLKANEAMEVLEVRRRLCRKKNQSEGLQERLNKTKKTASAKKKR